jgi:hypothetical protein
MALLAARVGTPSQPRTWKDVGRDVLAYFEERCGVAPAFQAREAPR